MYPQQAEHRARDHEMFQHISVARAEHILAPPSIRPYVPPYDPAELEEWTSHMNAHSRAGIHQLHLLIEKEAAKLAPGRKKKQLSAALHHMLCDIVASRRAPARTQLRRSSQRDGVVMRRPAARLILRSPQVSSASARNCLATGLCDALPLSASQPSPGATDFVQWLQTLDTAGVRWGGRAIWTDDSRCTAVLHLTELLPSYSVPALLDALPSLDT
eukprot:1362703-Rhodomonas_salina.1